MKTTVEISAPLLAAAKELAAREGTSLRDLIERGLRQIVGGTPSGSRFRLRRVQVKGNGLRAEIAEGSWERIRDIAYDGRGG